MKTHDPSFVSLLLIISFAAVNAVLFTPALPMIAGYFQISDDMAQQTVTFFLVGYALGQLLYSPMANRYGRKPALYLGISIQILSSIACVLAGVWHEFSLLVAARFVSALGSGVGLKMTFTIINEYYEAKVASKKIAYTSLAFSVMPAVSVALGGFLTKHYGWEACFYALTLYGALLLLLATRLPETLKTPDLEALAWHKIKKDYGTQFKNPAILIGGTMMGCCGAFIYSFAALAPFVAIDDFGMSAATYGLANMIPLIGLMLGGLHSANATQKQALPLIIRFGIAAILVGVVAMFVGITTVHNIYLALFMPVILIYFGTAHILPNASSIALASVHNKSHASAVVNFISMSFVTATLFVVSFVSMKPLPLLLSYYAIITTLMVFLFICWYKK
jgi:MFS family permease